MKQKLYFGVVLLVLWGCQKTAVSLNRITEFPKPVDTKSVPVTYQEHKTWAATTNVSFSNQFDGARLNNVTTVNDSTFKITVSPENFPINPSPWYSFKVWQKKPQRIYLNFDYVNGKHRYDPKLSIDNVNWKTVDEKHFNEKSLQLIIDGFKDTVTVSAQELFTEKHLNEWVKSLKGVEKSVIGQSPLKNDILLVELNPKTKAKDVIVLFSRQHPPEVTGQFALNHFVEALNENTPQTKAFLEKYRVLIFPMLNPDGVREGHWRHNSGGIDLNRDWDVYNQPETKQIAEYLIARVAKEKLRVVLGIDFHSTFEDIYYTNLTDAKSHLPNFTGEWLRLIKERIPNYTPNIAPSQIGQPVSKGWFYVQFGAVGITYEIGDATDREFIKTKSDVAAKAMMEILSK